jgi:hypothetical protein
VEALSVIIVGGHNMTLGAEMNAKKAFLAKLFMDFNMAFQNKSP